VHIRTIGSGREPRKEKRSKGPHRDKPKTFLPEPSLADFKRLEQKLNYIAKPRRTKMTKPKYAKDGYKFYRVCTPSFFKEFELPTEEEDMSESDRLQMQMLLEKADQYGTHIESSNYERG
jgi:hypothetical protein